jgi:DNA modification methylase
MDKVQIDTLKEYACNPRQISDLEFHQLCENLIAYGFLDPLVVDQDNVVLGGNQRLRAAKHLISQGIIDFSEVPVFRIETKGEQHKAEVNLLLNNHHGSYDMTALAGLIDELDIKIDDLPALGFSGVDLDDLNVSIDNLAVGDYDESKDDEIPEIDKTPVVKEGELWLLGEHRLLCGDCTVEANVQRLMDGKKADMVFTDPPYGMNLNTDYSNIHGTKGFQKERGYIGGKKYDEIRGDDTAFDPTFIISGYEQCKEIFLWGADYYCHKLPALGSWLVWDKRSNEDTDEKIVESRDKGVGSCFELCWSKARHKREIVRVMWNWIFGTEKEPEKHRVHPTQKPTRLADWFINKYSKENGLTIHLFLGSGTTLIACEKTNRVCFGLEIDPWYCTVILQRYLDYTGKQPTREDGKTFEEVKNVD